MFLLFHCVVASPDRRYFTNTTDSGLAASSGRSVRIHECFLSSPIDFCTFRPLRSALELNLLSSFSQSHLCLLQLGVAGCGGPGINKFCLKHSDCYERKVVMEREVLWRWGSQLPFPPRDAHPDSPPRGLDTHGRMNWHKKFSLHKRCASG